MQGLPANVRGIIYMLLATGTFVVNDTFLKLATEGLPPFETLFLRGVSAAIWCLPLVLFTGNGKHLRHVANRWVLLRNAFEIGAVLSFILALANLPIADVSAINLTTPVLLVLVSGLIYRERIGPQRAILIVFGFVGGLLVAQPTTQGISPYAVAAFGCALFSVGRDLAGKSVPAHIPALVVGYSIILCVMMGAGVAMMLSGGWVTPSLRHILLLLGSGLFLTFGHFFLFLSYRTGATGVVAPFFYMLVVWAVISQLFVFGSLPNPLAVAGIALILVSGVTIALLDERKRRLSVTA